MSKKRASALTLTHSTIYRSVCATLAILVCFNATVSPSSELLSLSLFSLKKNIFFENTQNCVERCCFRIGGNSERLYMQPFYAAKGKGALERSEKKVDFV